MDLTGNVALITGASRGIGCAGAAALARRCRCRLRRTHEHFGRIDILVNNAISSAGDLQILMKRYDLTMDVNVGVPFLAVRAVTPQSPGVEP